MTKINELIEGIKNHAATLSFCELLKTARDEIGLRQYRAAEHMKMTLNRLKNLETGYFRVMPRDEELREISEFYDLPLELVENKARDHVVQRSRVVRIKSV